ncbi:MAG TPA: hypothetical protein GXX51_07900 [Firmicutes bacterium]|nr:hypothetical protein [Bacillota bacterium]
MTGRERIIAALTGEVCDCIPYYESQIDEKIVTALFGSCLSEVEVSLRCGRDHVPLFMFAPIPVKHETTSAGRTFLGHRVASFDEVQTFKLPDVEEMSFQHPLQELITSAHENGLAANILLGFGVDAVINSVGLDKFAFALYDCPQVVCATIEKYATWARSVIQKAIDLGVDFIWVGDDIAWKGGPFFSPELFRRWILPIIRPVAAAITVPWIFHSDGDILPLVEDLLSLGMDAIHPLEPEAVDIVEFKKRYGHRITLVGNIAVDKLARGTPYEVADEVRLRLSQLAPGGRYIISSSNSIPSYVKPENYRAMIDTIAKYRK